MLLEANHKFIKWLAFISIRSSEPLQKKRRHEPLPEKPPDRLYAIIFPLYPSKSPLILVRLPSNPCGNLDHHGDFNENSRWHSSILPSGDD